MAPKSSSGKKHSKSSKKPSPSTPDPPPPSPLDEEDGSRSLLLAASTKYPSLISASAVVARISEVDSKPTGHSATIWLSHSAITAASIVPGSVVSVLKNGARLSWSLSYTMGGPAAGRIIFVSPIKTQSVVEHQNGTVKLQDATKPDVSSLMLCQCKNLHLRLVTLNTERAVSSETTFSTGGQFGASHCSSPKTPSPYRSKLTSSSFSQSFSSSLQGCSSKIDQSNGTSFAVSALRMELEDVKTRKLLEISTALWLCSRALLHGNLVAVPAGTQIFFLLVEVANDFYAASSGDNSLHDGKIHFLPQEIRTANSLGYAAAFLVDSSTKVHLLSPFPFPTENQDKGNQCMVGNEDSLRITKLGGLSKELAELREIISDKVFIDELDAIAPARKDGGEHLSQRMVVMLLKLMDEIRLNSVLVIAATNRPDSIDSALRRHGRFDREIEIGVPSRDQRLDILLTLLSEMDHSLADTEVRSLASTTHGFVGADLAALCNKAALTALRRYNKIKTADRCSMTYEQSYMGQCLKFNGFDNVTESLDAVEVDSISSTDQVDSASFLLSNLTISSSPSDYFDCANMAPESTNVLLDTVHVDNCRESCVVDQEPSLKVIFADFEKAKMEVRPSAMREVMVEIPNVSWDDIGGQEEVKRQLIEAVEWPQKHQDAFERVGIRPPMGILMFGPPGCSKTLMARAVASNARLNFLAVKGPELFSKWVGESEKAVRSLFAKARAAAPSIIFFDEIDGLAVTRGQENDGVSVADRVMTQLLVELDGLKQRVDVTVIAATNRPDKIDSALLRPGRFDRLLYVGPPDEADREDIFHVHLRKMPCSSTVSIRELAHLTNGCTGADISSICREAALAALEESLDIKEICMEHFKAAIGRVKPSEFQSYEELSAKFQRLVVSAGIPGFPHSALPASSIGYKLVGSITILGYILNGDQLVYFHFIS
ncbi:hypothetical protein ACLOJK_017021 [Asimina triloba]